MCISKHREDKRSKNQNATAASSSCGFSLIELLVVTGIIVILSSVLLANNSRFGGTITLQNLAYDIALSIRQAQVYGIAVQRYGAANFGAGYGMHFNTATPATYYFFADALLPENGLYDCPTPGSVCELVPSLSPTIQGGYRISDLCVKASGAPSESCGVQGVQQLHILFKRPEPDALISAGGNSCILSLGNCMESARIILESPRGQTISVVVEATGQISVQQ